MLDIERENRLSKVISLYSKGPNQEEMAHELLVDQSTVSGDLHFIKQEARKQVEKYLREDILFEYMRYMADSNEITRKLWQIVQNDNQTRNLQLYDQTKDIRLLYIVLVHLISEDKYLSDSVLKIYEKIITIIERIIILQDNAERTIKQVLKISKRVKEAESLQEELNATYAKAQKDNREMREIVDDIKLTMESEVEQPKQKGDEHESQND